jgi:hypothetical protein
MIIDDNAAQRWQYFREYINRHLPFPARVGVCRPNLLLRKIS